MLEIQITAKSVGDWRHPKRGGDPSRGHHPAKMARAFERRLYSCFDSAADLAAALDDQSECGEVIKTAVGINDEGFAPT